MYEVLAKGVLFEMRVSSLKIGQILMNMGVVTPEILREELAKQKGDPRRIGEILVEDKIATEQQICQALAAQFSIPYVDLENMDIDVKLADIVTESIATSNKVIPISLDNRTLTVAVADPLDYKAINTISTFTKLKINVVIAEETKILEKYRDLYVTQKAYDDAREYIVSQTTKGQNEELEEAKAATEDQPIIRFVNNLIEDAVAMKASDIHVEPMEKSFVIRFRIDGKLIKHLETSPDLAPSVTSRIKFIGGMNIAEKRIPQDGRINYRLGTQEIDMRISVLPCVFGEKIVMRITTALGIQLNKHSIGFLPENLKTFEGFLNSNRGIILLTGATGSGKSTTLYTALNEVMRDDINIVTVENPVEMIIPGITQVDINDKAGLTFASVLRAILRQDPDIIMIGEIRDRETAEIAASAAITGHLVLSTLHTYNAASSVIRLVDMGVEPFMVTSAVLGVVAQRLVRRLCPNCKDSYFASEEELKILGLPSGSRQKLYKEKGCDRCGKIGHKGRIAVHEVLPISTEIKKAIQENASTEDINRIAIKNGMIPMKENLRRLVINGTISMTTYLDTVSEDDII